MMETEKKHVANANGKYTVVRYKFRDGAHVVEFTYREGCKGTPEEWAAAHCRPKPDSTATVDSYESDVPVERNSALEK